MKRYGLGMLMCYVLLLVLVVCLWLQVARIIALGIRLNSASLTTAKLIQFFFFAGFILCLDQKDLNIFLIVKPILIELIRSSGPTPACDSFRVAMMGQR